MDGKECAKFSLFWVRYCLNLWGLSPMNKKLYTTCNYQRSGLGGFYSNMGLEVQTLWSF